MGAPRPSIVTSGTTEPSWGFRLDMLYGTDFRYTLPRGFLNDQLLNAKGNLNLYGFDLPQYYVNVYFPTIFQGTELRIGHLYCPYGVESVEPVSTPLMSRSYAFEWCAPTNHMGVMMTNNLNAQWQLMTMLINGDNTFIDAPLQEPMFEGRLQWTSLSKLDVVALSAVVGRAKFDAVHSLRDAGPRHRFRAGRPQQVQYLRPLLGAHVQPACHLQSGGNIRLPDQRACQRAGRHHQGRRDRRHRPLGAIANYLTLNWTPACQQCLPARVL